jgi:hypothetical protein
LAIYVVDEQGKIEREFTPVLDGTLKGPDAVFRLIEFYLSELHIEAATKVLFIADGDTALCLRRGVPCGSSVGDAADNYRPRSGALRSIIAVGIAHCECL